MYIPSENLTIDFYTVAYLTVSNSIQLKTYEKNYEKLVDGVKEKIEGIAEERKQARYDEVYGQANQKLQEAQVELEEQKQKAQKELKQAKQKLESGKQEIQTGKVELANKELVTNQKLAEGKKQLETAQKELKQKEVVFQSQKEKVQVQIQEAQAKLTALKTLQTQYHTARQTLVELQKNKEKLEKQLEMLEETTQAEQIKQLQTQIALLEENILKVQEGIKKIEEELKAQKIEILHLPQIIQESEEKIQKAQAELTQNEALLKNAKRELNKQNKNYETNKKTAQVELAKAKNTLNQAEKELVANEKKLVNAQEEADKKLQEAKEQIEKAKLKLEDIKKPEWYILDRNQNAGYVSYLQDADRIANIAEVFPLVFFIVAALTSLTSMARMVEEQRVQIGTLKALGYQKIQIASKYIIYASLATILGGSIGMVVCFKLLPEIVLDMYQMMYTIPIRVIEFDIQYAIIGMLAAILCTVGATIYSCRKALKGSPASLMRPKAPKPGKRVFLEKIPWIWSKLNFTKKVTARNLFRYKKRFLMTIIGVAGCTALIIAGFGLRDAIGSMIPTQYGKIFKYDMQVALKDNLTKKQTEEAYQKIAQIEEVQKSTKLLMQAIEITSKSNQQSIQLVVPQKVEDLAEFIELQNRKLPKQKYQLNDQGVIITEKLAKLLEIKLGDTITLKNKEDIEKEVIVAGITENYLLHYIYMAPSYYESLYQEEVRPNIVVAITKDLSETQEESLGKAILKEEEWVAGVSFLSVSTDIFEEVMENMILVVWILIIAAGLLAFVVLYNLSNANITERIRELATIKVLGFYPKEVFGYIGKEMIILTIIGILVGIVGGAFLTTFIIKTCELDTLMFNPKIEMVSYLYGVIITSIFAGVVNIGTYFALRKINMIESLKSVE